MTDRIPIRGPGSLGDSTNRRWTESFGVALLPIVGVTIARLVQSGFTTGLLNPVDLSFAMMSAAAVILVQALQSHQDRSIESLVPIIVGVLAFAFGFTSLAIVSTVLQEDHRDTLLDSSRAVVSAWDKGQIAMQPQTAPPLSEKDRVRIDEDFDALRGSTRETKGDSSFNNSVAAASVLCVGFLGYAFRTWKKL